MMSSNASDDPSDQNGAADRDATDRRSRSGGLSDWTDALRDVMPYLDLGWRLAGAAAFPPLIGYAVDAWLGTLPWGVLVGAAVGLASAVVQLRRLQHELDR
jgi:hypothetical protein